MSQKKITYRTFDEIVEERFREHPEEIAGFLETVLEEYDHDQDKKALLVALRQIAKANGRIILPDAQSYQEILGSLDFAKAVQSLRASLKDIREGNTQPAEAVFNELFSSNNFPR